MGAKVTFTWKQREQIIAIMENMHRSIVCPDNMDNAGVIALIRTCRDYCVNCQCAGLRLIRDKEQKEVARNQAREDLIERLNILSIRYYGQL